MTIREMRSSDAGPVAVLTTELGYPATEADIARRYNRIKDKPEAQLFVAEDTQGNVVGWIHLQVTYLLESDPRAEIWGLVVSAKARGSGVGRRLVEAGEAWAVAQGLKVVVVRSNRVRVHAHGFYEHLGYIVTKTQNAFRKSLG